MARTELVPLLIALMLLTGVCNTLLTKYQLQMFIGEMGSWLFIGFYHIYKRFYSYRYNSDPNEYQPIYPHDQSEDAVEDGRNTGSSLIRSARSSVLRFKENDSLKDWRIVLFGLPAMCDICGTTLMNVGLLFVAPSVYQMTRGALVFFVGLFSVIFLRRSLFLFQWFALFTVVLGVGIVGLAGASHEDQPIAPTTLLAVREIYLTISENKLTPEALRTTIGVLLIAGAQIFTASQFVLEEYILGNFALEPLKAVGWEGLFGFIVTALGMVIMHILVGRTSAGRYGYFDMVEGWHEVTQNKSIGISSILIMISIGGFNYFGLSVTRNVSATARSTIDTCRTLFIWMVSLFLGWESFKWLQILGFGLLVYGTFLFNQLIKPPSSKCIPRELDED
ncbi:Uncharacterized protein C12G12.12 [Erysiphe neolycopersici]|uniref:Uncharacterized protein C12G12.12 n=1 Tax=Erysiphe neolycopersici TaxID=212602 RepID=A0A420HMI6_9PEZI|nr:Uncharacterized protein C12G12.12 [Erysiphe neolycopersici]